MYGREHEQSRHLAGPRTESGSDHLQRNDRAIDRANRSEGQMNKSTTSEKHTPGKVTLNRWPSWLLKSIRAAIKDGRISAPSWPNESGWGLVQHVMGHGLIWDHWGRCGELLVTEPYADANGSEVRRQCRQFTKLLGLSYTISSESYLGHPGTIRIEFREQTPAEVTRKLQAAADRISKRHRKQRKKKSQKDTGTRNLASNER